MFRIVDIICRVNMCVNLETIQYFYVSRAMHKYCIKYAQLYPEHCVFMRIAEMRKWQLQNQIQYNVPYVYMTHYTVCSKCHIIYAYNCTIIIWRCLCMMQTIYIIANNHAPIRDISTHPSSTYILYLYWMLGIRDQLHAIYLIIWCFLCDGTLHPWYAHLCRLLYTSLHAALSLTHITIL